jgi:uncharacterized membrane protein YccC
MSPTDRASAPSPAILPTPSRADWVFTVRTLAAGLAALSIAWLLRLDQPQWSMMTVYIVSQPIAGMVLAKGFYRLVGTLVGAVAAVALASLGQAQPWLFAPLLAIWVALCTFVSSALRNPESYGAALAGYTAAIIALPAFGEPHLLVELAVARCSEIMLGIVCAAVAGRLVLPQLARETLVERLVATISGVARFAAGPYRGTPKPELEVLDAALIVDIQALAAMRAYASLEAPGLVTHGRHSRHTIGYLLSALSAARTLQARASHPGRALAPFRSELSGILEDIAAAPDGLREVRPLIARLDEIAARAEAWLAKPQVDDDDNVGIAARLAVLGEFAMAMRAVLQGLAALRLRSPHTVDAKALPALLVARDLDAAFTNAVRAGAATLSIATFWLATRWADAIGVAIIVAVVSSLFASLPNPIQSAWGFFKGTLIAVPCAFVVGQLVMPALPGLAWFALLSTPILIATGLAMADPRHASVATPFAINYLVFLNPRDVMAYDPIAFLNGAASILVGILLSIAIFAVVLPRRPRATARRLVQAMREDLLRLCLRRRLADPTAFQSLAYDRINQLMPLLDRRDPSDKALLDGCVASVTLGLEVLRLRRAMAVGTVPDAAARAIQHGLERLSHLLALPTASGAPQSDVPQRLRSAAETLGGSSASSLAIAASLRLIAALVADHATVLAAARS